MLNLYITSANKNDGKTFVSTGIGAIMQSLGYKTSIYKPIQTGGVILNGFAQSHDITFVKTIDPYINTKTTYIFKTCTEPLIASEEENEYIDIDLINKEYQKIKFSYDCTIVDGDSKIFSPLAPNITNLDLIRKLQIPVLFTITPNENAINDTLMSIYTMQEKHVNIRGILINKVSNETPKLLLKSIPRIIEEYTSIKILGLIPDITEKCSPENIISSILNGVDIETVFNVKIEKLG